MDQQLVARFKHANLIEYLSLLLKHQAKTETQDEATLTWFEPATVNQLPPTLEAFVPNVVDGIVEAFTARQATPDQLATRIRENNRIHALAKQYTVRLGTLDMPSRSKLEIATEIVNVASSVQSILTAFLTHGLYSHHDRLTGPLTPFGLLQPRLSDAILQFELAITHLREISRVDKVKMPTVVLNKHAMTYTSLDQKSSVLMDRYVHNPHLLDSSEFKVFELLRAHTETVLDIVTRSAARSTNLLSAYSRYKSSADPSIWTEFARSAGSISQQSRLM